MGPAAAREWYDFPGALRQPHIGLLQVYFLC